MNRIAICLAICALLPSLAVAQEKVQWQQDVEKAKALAISDSKLVVLHFSGTWCKPCQELERFVFVHPSLVRHLNGNVVPVKVDVDQSPQLASEYGVQAVPTVVIFNAAGKVLVNRSSPRSADDYIAMLEHAEKLQVEQVSTPAGPAMTEFQRVVQASRNGDFRATANTQPTMGETPSVNNSNDFRARGSSHAPLKTWPPSTDLAEQKASITPETASVLPPSTGSFQTRAGDFQPKATKSEAIRNPYTAQPQTSATEKIAAEKPLAQPQATGRPPIGMDGYCPVTLINNQRWTKGDAEWGCIHRGKLFLFVSKETRDQFLLDPESYSPLLGGVDPVAFHEQGTLIEGKRNMGVFYETDEGRQVIVLFHSSETREQFEREPTKFIQAVRMASQSLDQNTKLR